MVAAESMFNVLVLRSTPYRFGYRSSIDLWVTEDQLENARLMLLLAYIIVGHADWRSARIRLFACIDSGNSEKPADKLSALMTEWEASDLEAGSDYCGSQGGIFTGERGDS